MRHPLTHKPPRAFKHKQGVTLSVNDDSREYTHEIQVGPFVTDTACGTYTITNDASAEPEGGSQASVARAKSQLAVTVVGCSGGAANLASVGTAEAGAAAPKEAAAARVGSGSPADTLALLLARLAAP